MHCQHADLRTYHYGDCPSLIRKLPMIIRSFIIISRQEVSQVNTVALFLLDGVSQSNRRYTVNS